LAGLAAAQVRAGLDVSIVATWRTDPIPEVVANLESQGVRVTHVGPARNPMSRHADLPCVMRGLLWRTDVLHVHALWEQIQHVACDSARRRDVPYVCTPHGMIDPWNLSQSALKKRLYLALRMRKNLNCAAALHFTTQMERDVVARLGLRAPAIVEPLGLDTSQFQSLPAPGTFLEKHPQLAGKRLITYLGRLDKGKGLELLIPAFARIAPAFPEARLVLIGPDSHAGYRATVESMICQHNLADKTLLTGMLSGDAKLAALVDSYVMCHPSFHENFGMALVEGLACGTPVIVSDQVYLHPEFTAARVGAVTTTTVDSVAAELTRWLTDPALRAAAAPKSRPFALTAFDCNRIARHWVGHYERLCGKPMEQCAPRQIAVNTL
jgi:glycosyltransferase involved in cell wall biosynthesis